MNSATNKVVRWPEKFINPKLGSEFAHPIGKSPDAFPGEKRLRFSNLAAPNLIPGIACSEKRRLLQAFAKAVSDLNRIHSAQLAAVLSGDGFQFQEEFIEALDRKESAKYAVLARQDAHGC